MKHSPLSVALALALAACGTAGTGTTSEGPATTPSTTSVSAAGVGGTGNTSITSYADNGAVVQRVPRTPGQVWAVLRDAYADAGLAVGTADSTTHVVATPRFEVSRQLGGQRLGAFFSCGDTPIATPIAEAYRLTVTVESTVRPGEGGSRVETRATASAANPSTGARADCSSTGALETRVGAAVLHRLGLRD